MLAKVPSPGTRERPDRDSGNRGTPIWGCDWLIRGAAFRSRRPRVRHRSAPSGACQGACASPGTTSRLRALPHSERLDALRPDRVHSPPRTHRMASAQSAPHARKFAFGLARRDTRALALFGDVTGSGPRIGQEGVEVVQSGASSWISNAAETLTVVQNLERNIYMTIGYVTTRYVCQERSARSSATDSSARR